MHFAYDHFFFFSDCFLKGKTRIQSTNKKLQQTNKFVMYRLADFEEFCHKCVIREFFYWIVKTISLVFKKKYLIPGNSKHSQKFPSVRFGFGSRISNDCEFFEILEWAAVFIKINLLLIPGDSRIAWS